MKLNSMILATALFLAFAPLAGAQSQTAPADSPSAPGGVTPTTPSGAASPATGKLSETDVIHGLEAHGFTEVHTVGRNGDVLHMQAKKDGKPVSLVVNTVTRRATVRPR